MPHDVVAFIERVDGCVHWSGEYPFDDTRRIQIEQALRGLKCADLQKDVRILSREYAGSEVVRKHLDSVARESLIPSYDPFETERLVRDMPPDVADMIERADQCVVHLQERPSDDDRIAERANAMQALRCKDLHADLEWFRQQYASSRPIADTLRRFEEHYLRSRDFSRLP